MVRGHVWLLVFAGVATLYYMQRLQWRSMHHLDSLDEHQLLAAEFLWHHQRRATGPCSSALGCDSPHHTLTTPTSVAPERAGACFTYPHVDSWGYAPWGEGSKAATAAECCDRCLKARGSPDPEVADCNLWVWCADSKRCGAQYQDCWLKWLPYVHVVVPKEASFNDSVPWMSGTPAPMDLTQDMYSWKLKANRTSIQPVYGDEEDTRKTNAQATADTPGSSGGSTRRNSSAGGAGDPVRTVDPVQLLDTSLAVLKQGVQRPQLYHTAMSVQGPYNQWQTRIFWHHWRKMQRVCKAQGFCEMGGFTRLLHQGSPDQIMEEIPTVVVDPMPSSMLKHDDYVVLNRPYAFVMWVRMARVPERYILMAEPDHIYLRPLPNFMRGDKPAAFSFGYMNPPGERNCPIIQRHTGITSTPGCEQVAPIGNSPTWLTWEDLVKVAPLWLNVSMAVYQDQDARKVWGWVQEMYAFGMAMWLAGLRDIDLHTHIVAQPPFDHDYELRPGRPFYILHYTYPLAFNETTGAAIREKGALGDWHFNKREYDSVPPPRHLREPADTVQSDLTRVLIRSFNEATDAIPCWEAYRESHTQIVTEDCKTSGSPGP